MDAAIPFEINASPTIEHCALSEQYRCVIVDEFLAHPEKVIAYASQRASEFTSGGLGYPGVVYDLEAVLMVDIYRFIRMKLNKSLSFFKGSIRFSTNFSMAILKPEELSCLQRLCHSDPITNVKRKNIAALLYLFDNPALGGTAFYRWKEKKAITEATAIAQETPDKALLFLQERFQMFREPAQYITESNEVAELLHVIPARFNRLIVYPGDIPHSAYIEEPRLLSKDVSKGRLTLNCFASVLHTK